MAIISIIIENYKIIIPLLAIIIEMILRIIPSYRDNSLINIVAMFFDTVAPNRAKSEYKDKSLKTEHLAQSKPVSFNVNYKSNNNFKSINKRRSKVINRKNKF